MAGFSLSGLASGLTGVYPGMVKTEDTLLDLDTKKADAAAMAASNLIAQGLFQGQSLGMPSPQPPQPGQASQPGGAPQGGPQGMGQLGPPVSREEMMGNGRGLPPAQFANPQGGPPLPRPPQAVGPGGQTSGPAPYGYGSATPGGQPSMMGQGGPQQQPPMGPPPPMGAGSRPPGGAAPPGGQINLQTVMGAYQQAAQKHPELNNPAVFIKTMEKFAPLLQIADREKLLEVREQQFQAQEARLRQQQEQFDKRLGQQHGEFEENLAERKRENMTRDQDREEGLYNRDPQIQANKTALSKEETLHTAIKSFTDSTLPGLDALVELGDKVNKSGVPVLQRWINAGRKTVAGDPDVAQYDFQFNAMQTDVARIIQNPNLTGPLTVSAKKDIQEGWSKASTPQQLRAVVGRIKKDFENRETGITKEIDRLQDRIDDRKRALGSKNVPERPKQATPQASTGGPPPPPAAGEVRDGYRFKGGDPGQQSSWEPVK